MAQNRFYEEWKQGASYSNQFHKVSPLARSHRMLLQTKLENATLEEASKKFFACTDEDMAEYRAEQERNRPVDPKTLIK